MITLHKPPRLVAPTYRVRISYLTGEQAVCVVDGVPGEWLGPASVDFSAFVKRDRGVVQRWGVPTSDYWYVSGEHYLGSLVIRHWLTPELEADGGHIGYRIVPPWRRQGHATRMLAEGLDQCRGIGLSRVLLTCSPANRASIRVIEANAGVLSEARNDLNYYWIRL